MSDEAERILAWVYWRSRHGVSSFKRSQRDAALSDINAATQQWADKWKPSDRTISKDKIWCGEQP